MTEIKGKIKLGNISIGEGKIHRAGIRKKIKIRKYKAWRKEYTYCIAWIRRKIQIRKYSISLGEGKIHRAGTSLIGFLSESLVFVFLFFGERPERITHGHSFLVSDRSAHMAHFW